MNTNIAGARTLAYLRGEKDLIAERQRLAKMRKQLTTSGLAYWLARAGQARGRRFWQLVAVLAENSRMSLTEMSRQLDIPNSTLFDLMKEVRRYFCFTIVLKDKEKTALIENTRALVAFSYQRTKTQPQQDPARALLSERPMAR